MFGGTCLWTTGRGSSGGVYCARECDLDYDARLTLSSCLRYFFLPSIAIRSSLVSFFLVTVSTFICYMIPFFHISVYGPILEPPPCHYNKCLATLLVARALRLVDSE